MKTKEKNKNTEKKLGILLFFILIPIMISFSTFIRIEKHNTEITMNSFKPKPSNIHTYSLLWEYSDVRTIGDVAISADGEYIAAITGQNLTLFRSNSSQPIWTSSYGGADVVISADGKNIATTSGSKGIRAYYYDDSTPSWHYSNPSGEIYWIDISANGEYIIGTGTYGAPGVVLLHNSTNIPIWTDGVGGYAGLGVSISSNGTYFIVAKYGTGDDGEVALFNRTGSSVSLVQNYYISESYPFSVDISENGSYIAVGAQWPAGAILFNMTSTIPMLNHSGIHCWSTAISSDGKYMATGNWNTGVFLFERSNSLPLWNKTMIGKIYDLAMSSNGSYIIGSLDKNLFVFHKSSHIPVLEMTMANDINGVDISANANLIVFCSGSSFKVLHQCPMEEAETKTDNEDNANNSIISGYSLILISFLISLISVYRIKKFNRKK